MAAISDGDLKEIGNEGSLCRHVPPADGISLPLPDHRHASKPASVSLAVHKLPNP